MALKATVFKVQVSISDLNRNYYHDHALTLARHPSETDLRMLVRIVAFALNAHEHLQFTKGLADADEPDIWQKSLTGDIEHWIDLGQPAEKRIRQSCGKSKKVSIYTYQKSSALIWYAGLKDQADRFRHLSISQLSVNDEAQVPKLIDRSMQLSCFIQDEQILLTRDAASLSFELMPLKL